MAELPGQNGPWLKFFIQAWVLFFDQFVWVILQILKVLIHEAFQKFLVAAQSPLDFFLELRKLGKSVRLGFRLWRVLILGVFWVVCPCRVLLHRRYKAS